MLIRFVKLDRSRFLTFFRVRDVYPDPRLPEHRHLALNAPTCRPLGSLAPYPPGFLNRSRAIILKLFSFRSIPLWRIHEVTPTKRAGLGRIEL